jgi:hypothetical protein
LHNSIERIQKTRISLLKIIEGLTTEALNKIPERFNNNVIWNLGHLLASQQSICYVRNGIQPFIDEKFLLHYKAGTKPGEFVTAMEIGEIKSLFLQAIDQFGNDYEAGFFSGYPSWTTGYGMEIHGIEDAINFNLFHEGLHRGYIMALKRVL